VLEEAAVHFISRDRSKLSDDLIVPRLKTLGLLAQPPRRSGLGRS
jgi:hypothetical protein